ncbi:hypothetical protein M422DRAFT_240859 [Sphaerobolus stellatus SS14]|nr:hypothetical protein M422DRAFT_240859 [Sphaerobolus stellatus SS14]
MDAENDIMQALESIGELTKCLVIALQVPQPLVAGRSPNNIPLPSSNPPQQLRNRITGSPLTLEEMLNPMLEREIGDSCYRFEGGNQEILEQVKHEMAIQSGEVIEVDSDSEEEAEEGDKHSIKDVIRMCEMMERLCLRYGEPDTSLDLCNRDDHTMSHKRGVTRRARTDELFALEFEDSEPTTGDLTNSPSHSVDPQQSLRVLAPEHPDETYAQAYGSQTAPSRVQSPTRVAVPSCTVTQGLSPS